MFPLITRKLIRGCAAHLKAGLGCGSDYSAYYVPLYASHSGTLYEPYWYKFGRGQGGKWLGIIRPNGDKIEFAHLSQYIRKSGSVFVGEKIGITGNTGYQTTGPHLHVQVLRGSKRLDPDKYDWSEPSGVINVPKSFKRIWGRDGAPGEINYFVKRLQNGTITGAADLDVKLKYWYSTVYPNGQYSSEGDQKWQRAKASV